MQIGVVAYRDKEGNFLSSMPIYRDFDDEKTDQDGLTEEEKQICDCVAKYLIATFSEYMQHEKGGTL